jgi:hypothetical protein
MIYGTLKTVYRAFEGKKKVFLKAKSNFLWFIRNKEDEEKS